eukprot:TRINITY_DN3156_c0_g2_i2.p1 TRINITY_DN3156_c0_g2~~TRINITY_DN3156_c0_g2_i2.p1  ORF type:complete len:339 (+),score=64.38 TRINITY_DN3156_c0_g2_i2:101-1018(+)
MDGWNEVMVACMVQPPDCTAGVDCGFSTAPLFFVIFQLFAGFIMLNLFVAVLLGTLMNLTELEKSIANDSGLNMFAHTWSKFDPQGKGFIRVGQLLQLRTMLRPPYGCSRFFTDQKRRNLLLPLRIPITVDGRVHFTSVLLEFVRHVIGVTLPPNATHYIRNQIETAFELEEMSAFSVSDHAAATIVQTAWRSYLKHRHEVATAALDPDQHIRQLTPRRIGPGPVGVLLPAVPGRSRMYTATRTHGSASETLPGLRQQPDAHMLMEANTELQPTIGTLEARARYGVGARTDEPSIYQFGMGAGIR